MLIVVGFYIVFQEISCPISIAVEQETLKLLMHNLYISFSH